MSDDILFRTFTEYIPEFFSSQTNSFTPATNTSLVLLYDK